MAGGGERELVRPGIDHADQERHEPPHDAMVVNVPIHPGEHVAGRNSGTDQVANLRADAGHDQGGGHPLARDITQRHGPAVLGLRRHRGLLHRDVVVKVAPDLLSRPVAFPEQVAGNLRLNPGEERPLNLPGRRQGRSLLDQPIVLDGHANGHGQGREQLQVLLLKIVVARKAIKLDHADRLALVGRERHADRRADEWRQAMLRAQNRISTRCP